MAFSLYDICSKNLTKSHRHPYGIRSGGGRNLIGRRTESDRTAYANGGTLRGALVSARLCRLPEQEVHQPSKKCTLCKCVKTHEWHAPKGQKHIAQGSALGKRNPHAPCAL